jgi:hypothetical protein
MRNRSTTINKPKNNKPKQTKTNQNSSRLTKYKKKNSGNSNAAHADTILSLRGCWVLADPPTPTMQQQE